MYFELKNSIYQQLDIKFSIVKKLIIEMSNISLNLYMT